MAVTRIETELSHIYQRFGSFDAVGDLFLQKRIRTSGAAMDLSMQRVK